MNSHAQTRIQLFNDLIRRGWSGEDLTRIRNADHLAMAFFTGLVRPSGKTFIDHAVATAGILAALDVRTEVVTAGLLHAAYTHGDFGPFSRGMSPANRLEVRRAVGDEIESLIAAYTRLKWNSQTIPIHHQRLPSLEREEREVLLIRLANELEDHLELGALYCSDAELRRDFVKRCGAAAVSMAAELGFPGLSAELRRAFRETETGSVPPELRHAGRWTRAHLIAPASTVRRRSAVAWDFIHRVLKRFSLSGSAGFDSGRSGTV